MSQPTPAPGIYIDSTGTRYAATHHKKLGWHIQELSPLGRCWGEPYQKPDFPAAVLARIFTFQSDPK